MTRTKRERRRKVREGDGVGGGSVEMLDSARSFATPALHHDYHQSDSRDGDSIPNTYETLVSAV